MTFKPPHVTKEVVLKVEFTGKGKGAGPQGTIVPGRDPATMVSGWEATTTLKRSDFGITWNQMIEGTRVVGDDVQIELLGVVHPARRRAQGPERDFARGNRTVTDEVTCRD